MTKRILALPLLVGLVAPLTARAGAKLKINDDVLIDLAMRLQTQLVLTEADRDGDGTYERQVDFNIRRARLKFRGDIGKWATAYVQTDFEQQDGTSADSRIIDAYVLLKPHKLAWIYVGENMAPALRLNVTSSGGLMTLDRSALTYKSLTWGARSKYAFTNTTYGPSNSGLNKGAKTPVRDMGATLFGAASPTGAVHLKYYLGLYDGVQTAGDNAKRVTARAQVNFLDAEPKYYNDGTYLGEKRTVGVGATYDRQASVALDQATGTKADYRLYSLDLFAELPLPVGAVDVEGGYLDLDLGGGGALAKADGTALGNAARAQGSGWYAQAGYYWNAVQPWVQVEAWSSDDAGGAGGYKAYRAGLNYFLKGHDAKIVAGYERFVPEVALSTSQDAIQSFVLGAYLDF